MTYRYTFEVVLNNADAWVDVLAEDIDDAWAKLESDEVDDYSEDYAEWRDTDGNFADALIEFCGVQ